MNRTVLLIVLLPSLATARGQSPDIPNMRTGEIQSISSLLPPDATNDAAASKLLESFIAKAGGHSRWNGVHGIQTRYAVREGNRSTEYQILAADDWSGENVSYRRGHVGSKRAPVDHDGKAVFTRDFQGRKAVIPEFDRVRLLAGTVPAAAIQQALEKPEYRVKSAPPYKCQSDRICVGIYRQVGRGTGLLPESVWTFHPDGPVLDRVSIRLPNPLGPKVPWETFVFKEWTTFQDLRVPSSIDRQLPLGLPEHRRILSFKTINHIDKTSFDSEAKHEDPL